MNIGLIGTGSIGNFLLKKINQEQVIPHMKITALFDERSKSASRMGTLAKDFDLTSYDQLDVFLESSIDLVIECANIETVKMYSREIASKKDLFMISVGALADVSLHDDLQSITRDMNKNIYLPSGAIGGLDVLRASHVLGGLDTVQLTTRKPAQAFSMGNITQEKVIFSGAAKEAINRYPQNANIAIIISLAGIGMGKTKVKIIADPMVKQNIHTLQATGDFGDLELTVTNNPSPNNPKTSYLTALSILSSLQSLQHMIRII